MGDQQSMHSTILFSVFGYVPADFSKPVRLPLISASSVSLLALRLLFARNLRMVAGGMAEYNYRWLSNLNSNLDCYL
jgi:hypothetical protein